MVSVRNSQAYIWTKHGISIVQWHSASTYTERFEVLAVLGVGAAAASVASLMSVPAFRFLGVICTELDMLPAEIESNSISNLSTDVIDVCLGRGDGRTSRG